jgi:hypothetical protein
MSYEFAHPEKREATIPDFWIARHDFTRIESLPISEPVFATGASIIRDTVTDKLGIDTRDLLPDLSENVNYDHVAGILRVVRPDTNKAHHDGNQFGFIADLRTAKNIATRNLCCKEYDDEAASENERWNNELLLGAVFLDDDSGKLHFQSEYYDELLPYAISLLEFVDDAKARNKQAAAEKMIERNQKKNRVTDYIRSILGITRED